jgi:hypothetical protein
VLEHVGAVLVVDMLVNLKPYLGAAQASSMAADKTRPHARRIEVLLIIAAVVYYFSIAVFFQP